MRVFSERGCTVFGALSVLGSFSRLKVLLIPHPLSPHILIPHSSPPVYALFPSPLPLHPTPSFLRPSFRTPHPFPLTLHSTPQPSPQTLTPHALHFTLNPSSLIPHPSVLTQSSSCSCPWHMLEDGSRRGSRGPPPQVSVPASAGSAPLWPTSGTRPYLLSFSPQPARGSVVT